MKSMQGVLILLVSFSFGLMIYFAYRGNIACTLAAGASTLYWQGDHLFSMYQNLKNSEFTFRERWNIELIKCLRSFK